MSLTERESTPIRCDFYDDDFRFFTGRCKKTEMSEERNESLARYSGENLDGPGRSSPYPTSRLAGPISLVDTAAEIARASESISHQTNAQLEVIARQIRHLQEQARAVLEKAQDDLELHQAQCSFARVPGRSYYLYKKNDHTLVFSMLSPADYAGDPPHEFVGSYRLEANNSWTLAETATSEPE